MVDPFKITKYNRTEKELQEFLLFCIVAAGKTATVQAEKLDSFIKLAHRRFEGSKLPRRPFDNILGLLEENRLVTFLQAVKMGQYNRISNAFASVVRAGLDLSTCSLADLEVIPGIGRKTSRFFLMHTRPGQRYAVLDTHILKYMTAQKLAKHVPKNTPSSRSKYEELEKAYLEHLEKLNVRDVAAFDLAIWTKYTKSKPKKKHGLVRRRKSTKDHLRS